jgi:hypothetical protein
MPRSGLATVHQLRPAHVLVVSGEAAWVRAARALLDLRGCRTSGLALRATTLPTAAGRRWDVLLLDATDAVAHAARLFAAADGVGRGRDVVLVARIPELLPAGLVARPRDEDPEGLVDAVQSVFLRPRKEVLRAV